MTQIKYWFFIATLSITFPNNSEGYRFIGNSTQDYYQDLESIFEMSFGPWVFYAGPVRAGPWARRAVYVTSREI